jgi:hypothetical protein
MSEQKMQIPLLPIPSVIQLELKAFCEYLKPDLLFTETTLASIHSFLEKITWRMTEITFSLGPTTDIYGTLLYFFPNILKKECNSLLLEKSRNPTRINVDELYKYFRKTFDAPKTFYASEKQWNDSDFYKRADDLTVIFEFIVKEIVEGAAEATYCDERQFLTPGDIKRSIWGDDLLEVNITKDSNQSSNSHFSGDEQLRALAASVHFEII